MICRRCKGLMIFQALADFRSRWWRCVNCGERFDFTVLNNRKLDLDVGAARDAEARSWARWIARLS